MSKQLLQLAINFIPQVGAVTAKSMISYCGGVKELFEAKKRDLLRIPGIGDKKAAIFIEAREQAIRDAEKELALIEKSDIDIIFYLDKHYPARLKQINDAPLILYKKGNIEPNPNRTVAIVGTRKPSHYGIRQCQRIIEELEPYNCTIISGLAYGVDTIAHRQAVQCAMPTIGILGNGLNKIYPSSNHELASKMMEKGGLYSEFPINTKPDRENFPMRNRIIAAMSDAILVVESGEKGGSIITADLANGYYKDVFAIPGNLGMQQSVGCNHLIKSHRAHLCTSADDIAYIMRWDQKSRPEQMQLNLGLNDKEQTIYSFLQKEHESAFDQLIYATEFALPELNALLLNLEFKGLIKSLPGKKYILA